MNRIVILIKYIYGILNLILPVQMLTLFSSVLATAQNQNIKNILHIQISLLYCFVVLALQPLNSVHIQYILFQKFHQWPYYLQRFTS